MSNLNSSIYAEQVTYPMPDKTITEQHGGLTKLEYAAIQFMAAKISTGNHSPTTMEGVAEQAVSAAKALFTELEKPITHENNI